MPKKMISKKKEKVYQSFETSNKAAFKQEMAAFTPSRPEEATVSPPLISVNTEEETFWHAKKGVVWMSFFGLSILLSLIAGLYIYREDTTILVPVQTNRPTPGEKPKVSLSPVPEKIEVANYNIVVLNGSGIQGEAARVKSLLEQEGFTVESIGNSDNPDYENTSIQTKKNTPEAFISKLKSILEKSQGLGNVELLISDEEDDVIVTLGDNTAANPE